MQTKETCVSDRQLALPTVEGGVKRDARPSTLPRSQWLSYTRLFSIVQPYAPARVWRQGRGNLKQLVTEWCQHHPAYAGLAKSAWCIRLKDDDQPQPQAGQKHSTVSKFCLEYTP